MNKKHHERVFEVNGVKLRLRKLGLAEFPSFKTIYATAIENKDIEGTIKAHQTLFSWLEYEVLPDEWVPVYNKTQDEFIIDKLNDIIVADTIINTLLIEVLTPLFLNTAELTK